MRPPRLPVGARPAVRSRPRVCPPTREPSRFDFSAFLAHNLYGRALGLGRRSQANPTPTPTHPIIATAEHDRRRPRSGLPVERFFGEVGSVRATRVTRFCSVKRGVEKRRKVCRWGNAPLPEVTMLRFARLSVAVGLCALIA